MTQVLAVRSAAAIMLASGGSPSSLSRPHQHNELSFNTARLNVSQFCSAILDSCSVRDQCFTLLHKTSYCGCSQLANRLVTSRSAIICDGWSIMQARSDMDSSVSQQILPSPQKAWGAAGHATTTAGDESL